MTPLLTLLVPNYNRPEALNRLLRSIFFAIDRDHLCEKVEVLVIDDFSSEDIVAAITPWKQRSNFEFRMQTHKCGNAERAFLEALKHVKTPYTWLLGNDDFVSEDSVRHMLYLLDRRPYGFILLNPRIYKRDTSSTYLPIRASTPALFYSKAETLFKDFGFVTSTTTFPCLIFRTRPVSAFHVAHNLPATATVYSHTFTLFAALKDEPALFLSAPLVGFSLNERLEEHAKLVKQAPNRVVFHHQTIGLMRLIQRTSALTGVSLAEFGEAREDEVDKDSLLVQPTQLSHFITYFFLAQLIEELQAAERQAHTPFLSTAEVHEVLDLLAGMGRPDLVRVVCSALEVYASRGAARGWKVEFIVRRQAACVALSFARYSELAETFAPCAPQKIMVPNHLAFPTRAQAADGFGKLIRPRWAQQGNGPPLDAVDPGR